MEQIRCATCGKEIESQTGASFCPFCGAALAGRPMAPKEPEAVQELLTRLESMKDAKKKHEALLAAEKEYPDSLAIARELLYMGRLHESGSKTADFSIIKSFILMGYLEPEQFSAARRGGMREELFRHPQLQRCLALTDEPDAFMAAYLLHLSTEFIRLFLRGDSRYMRRIFGFALDTRAAKLLAEPVTQMLQNIRQDGGLDKAQQELLMRQLYEAFSRDMAGETTWLDDRMLKAGVELPKA